MTTPDLCKVTGPGLCLDYDIVVKHNSAFEVDKREGEYTEFTVKLLRLWPEEYEILGQS